METIPASVKYQVYLQKDLLVWKYLEGLKFTRLIGFVTLEKPSLLEKLMKLRASQIQEFKLSALPLEFLKDLSTQIPNYRNEKQSPLHLIDAAYTLISQLNPSALKELDVLEFFRSFKSIQVKIFVNDFITKKFVNLKILKIHMRSSHYDDTGKIGDYFKYMTNLEVLHLDYDDQKPRNGLQNLQMSRFFRQQNEEGENNNYQGHQQEVILTTFTQLILLTLTDLNNLKELVFLREQPEIM
eukprot:403368231